MPIAVCEYRHGEGGRKVCDYRQKPGARTLAQFISFVSPRVRTARKSFFAKKKNERPNNAEIRFLPVVLVSFKIHRRSEMNKKSLTALAVFMLCVLPSQVFAHHAEWMHGRPFIQGLSMPIHGLDHMLVTVAVGLIAVQIGGHALWAVPSAFSLLLLLGGLLNVNGIAVPFVEQGIFASIVVLGAVLTVRPHLPILLSLLIIGCFATIHGNALIQQTPGEWSFFRFSAGCLLAAAALQAIGIGLGLIIKRITQPKIFRYVGAAMLVMSAVIYTFPSVNDLIIHFLE
jgi:urease accessory protein